MTKVAGNIWSFTFPSDPSGLTGFIFNAGISNGGDANQTADFMQVPLKNHLYKGAGGNKGAVTDMGEYTSGVTDVMTDNMKVFVNGSSVVIISDCSATVPVHSLTGVTRMVDVQPGVNTFDGFRGLIIINGTKLMVR